MFVCMEYSITGEEGVRDEAAWIQNERSVLVGGHTGGGQGGFGRNLLYVTYVFVCVCMYCQIMILKVSMQTLLTCIYVCLCVYVQ